jgi:thioredoxin 1
MAHIISSADFDAQVLKSPDVVLVDFFANWCGPCQALLPVIDELSKELGKGAKIVKVDVDESSDLAGKYGVMSIPALKVFKNGKVVEEVTGMRSKDALKQMIEKHL